MLCCFTLKPCKAILKASAALPVFFVSQVTNAFDYTVERNTHINQHQAAELNSIRAMSDEMLYLSAEARRNNIEIQQVEPTNLWPENNTENHLEGVQAVKHIAALSLRTLAPRLFQRGAQQQHDLAVNKVVPALLNVRNYNLDLTADNINIQFSYQFN